jgi:ABC-type antimicrobial peptide transport system permease subunit
MGVPVLEGRAFAQTDTDKSQKVAIVSETFARRFFPNNSPVGRRFGDDEKDTSALEIVGVVKDVKYYNLTEAARPMVYYPHAQGTGPLGNFAVRFSGAPGNVVPQVRQVIRSVNNNMPVDEVVTLSDHISRSLVQQKLVSRLALFFGLLALLVACLGLYGVLSYSVTQRKNEIGVRLALGASSFTVLRMVLKDGLKTHAAWRRARNRWRIRAYTTGGNAALRSQTGGSDHVYRGSRTIGIGRLDCLLYTCTESNQS